MRTILLYLLTAAAEIGGCYCVYLWVRLGKTSVWLIPGVLLLALFAWLLTLHPLASGRIYAAYGGVYILSSILWLWIGDGLTPDMWDWIGAALCLTGASVIYFGPR